MEHERASALNAEIVVVGGGPAGLTTAIALACNDIETVLVAPRHVPDNRTTALLAGSIAALTALDVWPRCRAEAALLTGIRLVDDRGGLLRAPEVTFRADEIGLDAFGCNVENRVLVAALAARAAELPPLTIIEAPAAGLALARDTTTVRLADGRTVTANLVVGADGRNSLCRRAADIALRRWSYPQSAITCNLTHTRPHGNISTEFHTASGPCTLVPLTGQRSSLVWVVAPHEAERLAALDAAAFCEAVRRQTHAILGTMQLDGERVVFPLAGHVAQRFAASRVSLVGEAAHLIPPIGAQGFNLGLRDAAVLAEMVVATRRLGYDPGDAEHLERYHRARLVDVQGRTLAVDLLNRSLLHDFLPVQAMRGLGLTLLDRFGPLRRAVMREGVAPRLGEPALMRGERL